MGYDKKRILHGRGKLNDKQACIISFRTQTVLALPPGGIEGMARCKLDPCLEAIVHINSPR